MYLSERMAGIQAAEPVVYKLEAVSNTGDWYLKVAT
jgi:hypothetical protein